VVLVAAALFAIEYLRTGLPVWRVRGLNFHLALATAVILISFLHGWLSFGWTDWAFANKTLGWFMLLCYSATGALIVRRASENGLNLLLLTFIAAGAALTLVDLTATALVRTGVELPWGFVSFQISGFSQNPNAFAFALLMVLTSAFAARMDERLRFLIVTLTLIGVWFTGSRAGIGAALVLLLVALWLGTPWRLLAYSNLAATGVVLGIAVLPHIISPFATIEAMGFLDSVVGTVSRSAPETYLHHLTTVQDGLSIFWDHLIWGAGLGAYIDAHIRAQGFPLIIHSTPVWLLAETGLVGFLVFASAAVRIGWAEFGRSDEMASKLLLLILCAFAVMSSVHELLYQRGLWLLMGAALALPPKSAFSALPGSRLAKARAEG
ncbi:MAG: O-antigen ligase family protein, partial [Xanthobacteraceae bacterium]